MKKIILFLAVICLNLSCQKDENSKPDLTLKMIKLSEETLNLIVGDSHTFKVSLTPVSATVPKFKWKSSNEEIVEVSEGKLLAKKDGEAIISVETEDGKITASCKVTVSMPDLTGIAIDEKEVSVSVGQDVQLNVILSPSNAKPEEMVWSSSDSTVAKISTTGLVKTLKPGKATIKVTSKSGKFTATSELTVTPVLVQSITISNTYSLVKGTTAKLAFGVSPT
ncbi:MAG: Ig-like domain-containing protein, partial [Daejeonella sp.]|uniref:Ig-like domain-containing protein n=1 Tax=Daejeonella sp. TaxID=2805397 RepID=UPI003C7362F1